MITVNEAIAKLNSAIQPLAPEKVALNMAVGLKLNVDIKSSIDVPGFDCSIMDGIALRVQDIAGKLPTKMPIQAIIAAGNNGEVQLQEGHVVKIMTGAPIPNGADTVIKIEDIIAHDNQVTISERPEAGAFVRPRGDDIKTGDLILRKGTILSPIDIGILASLGMTEVDVIRRPRVAILSTGTEIIDPGAPLNFGQRYDSNKATLETLLANHGYNSAVIQSIAPDKLEGLREVLEKSLKENDLVISSGGVSMGDYDYIPDAIIKLGGKILFHKVKVKPGKPILVASLNGRWLIALPGNPVGVVAGFHLHIKRALGRLTNQTFTPKAVKATAAENFEFRGNRFGMLGARLYFENDTIMAQPVKRQNSGRLSSVKGINGFIMLEESERSIAKGDTVTAEYLYE